MTVVLIGHKYVKINDKKLNMDHNKMLIHSDYVNDEFEIGQRYTYMQMLCKSMFIQNKIEWQKFSKGNTFL